MVSRPYGEPSIARKDTRRAFVTALSSREKRDNIVRYRVSNEHSHHRIWRTLVDRGANGCILGKDTRVVHLTDQYIDLNGIDDHTVRNLRIGTGAGLVMSNQGPVVLRFHQGAIMHDGKTIISPGQMEYFGCQVFDRPKFAMKAHPFLVTPTGDFKVPMAIQSGLPYIKMRAPTDDELNDPDIPHIDVTSPMVWDPTCLDSVPPEDWYESHRTTITDNGEFPLDPLGELRYEDPDFVDHSDRHSQSLDRRGILVATANLIRDELYSSDDDSCPDAMFRCDSSDSESDSDDFDIMFPDRECHVRTRSGRASGDGEKNEPTRRNPPRIARKKSAPRPPTTTKSPSAPPSNPTEPTKLAPVVETVIENDDLDDQEELTSNNRAKHFTGIEIPPKSKRYNAKTNVESLRRFFVGVSDDAIRRTLEATTQYGTRGAVDGTTLRSQIKSPNPILNIPRRQEDVATDTVYSNTPAIDDGSTAAQFFIGKTSRYRSIVPAGTSDASFIHTLMYEIRKRGAMNTLISDNAQAQINRRIETLLGQLCVNNRQSEPHRGNQNPAELGYRDVKLKNKLILDTKNVPAYCWLVAAMYVCELMNHIALECLGWRTPYEWMYGYTPDISALLQFEFYEPVYYQKYGANYPSDPTESVGRFVGIARDVGHGMTYKILTENYKIIHRAVVRTARKTGPYANIRANEQCPNVAPEPKHHNVPLEDPLEEGIEKDEGANPEFFDSIRDSINKVSQDADVLEGGAMPTVDITNLLNRTFISDPDENGEQYRSKIISAEPTGQTDADGTDVVYKFKCKHGTKYFEEIVAYNKMLEWCDRDLDKDDMYRIETILSHRPSKTKSKWEVLVQWASAETSWQDMGAIFNDDPVTISIYALKNNLLKVDGWKRCKPYVKNRKKFARMAHQAKLKNFRNKPVYMYGYQVPRNHAEAVFIDEKNGNTKWQDAEKLEISQLNEYDTFKSLGLGAPIPEGHQKIPCHMIYAVKHDGRHKARFVAGGHRTETPTESVYSGVVSLQGIRLVSFIAELNGLDLWGTDIGNAYLESYTTEKVCFIAGPEFGELAGHTMKMVKAQYGLRGSGLAWHNKLYDVLTAAGFTPSRAEPDIWMRDCGDHYEYIACYVDDLLIASKNPQGIIDMLEGAPHKFKLKGTGPIEFHLGCNFIRDPDGTLAMAPLKYIERIKAQYISLFGEDPPKKNASPLEKNDHPELDTSPLLDDEGITKYQSLIGALQWAITLGRFDIAVSIMSLSSFRVAPRVGHLERLKRITGYLCKMKDGAIRIRTAEPDYSQLPNREFDWERTVYGGAKEHVPKDAPTPKGKPVVLTTYVDANLYHDWVNGKAVTGVLHYVNQTPFEWYCKKQATVEVATYGSEFVAAKTAVEQAMASRVTLRYLGIPVKGSTYMFGDNGSVVTNSTQPHSPLKKRHHALSYHFVREAIAAKAIAFHHIPGEINPADILTKHWGYAQIRPILQAILFWRGNPGDLLDSKHDDEPGGEQ